MSNAVFPTLGGLDIKVKRTPLWSTEVLTSESGKEQRAAWWSTPRFKWSLGFNYLRQGLNGNEAKTLVDFFHQHRGQFESFLFADPYESAVTAKLFGTGTGAVAAYQLVDGAGYPVTEVNGTPTIYRNGALLVAGVDYTLSSTGLVTLASTTNPVASQNLGTASGSTATFPVVTPNGSTPTVQNVWRTDWQGTQLLYSTARTNWLVRSNAFGTAPWGLLKGGNGSLPVVTTSYGVGPDGVAGSSTRVVLDGGTGGAPNYSILRNTASNGAGSPIVMSLWMKSNTGSTYKVSMYDGNTDTGVVCSVTPVWTRFNYPIASPLAGVPFHLLAGYTLGADNFSDIQIFESQIVTGTTTSGIIHTDAATATVTDYSQSASNVVFASNPLAGAVIEADYTYTGGLGVGETLTWTGTYYRRVRFDMDELDLERIYGGTASGGGQTWEGKTVKLISVK